MDYNQRASIVFRSKQINIDGVIVELGVMELGKWSGGRGVTEFGEGVMELGGNGVLVIWELTVGPSAGG